MPDLHKIKPHPSLGGFIKEYWYVYWQKACAVPISNTPTPEEGICFFPRNLPSAGVDDTMVKTTDTFIIRQSTTRLDMLTPNDYSMFKIVFTTGGFFSLFGIPMSLFTNGHTETISVLGNAVAVLKEQISNAKSFEEMAGYADTYLMERAATIKNYVYPIDRVINQKGLYQYSLDKLAADACLSNRQFERKFFERTGVNPKLYQRIAKFNEAMKIKKKTPKLTWIDITYMTGYYDQMHLLRDFKQFTNLVPTSFDFENAIIY